MYCWGKKPIKAACTKYDIQRRGVLFYVDNPCKPREHVIR